MMQTQFALIRREIWEHRSLYIVPLVLGLLILLASITGQVAISTAGEHVDIALLGASNLGEEERSVMLNVLLLGTSWLFFMSMVIVMIFYPLDCLYSERKDKSILFWRSLPVTDAETIVSKLATAVLVIPALTLAVIAVTHVAMLIATSIWVGLRGADAWHLIWSAAPLLDNWLATFILMVAFAVWMSPFVGWFMFVSTFAKRSPFLMGFLPLVVIPMLESILFGSKFFVNMLAVRSPLGAPILNEASLSGAMFEEEEFLGMVRETNSVLALIDVGRFVSSPSVWVGIVVCGLFCTAAIYVRRYRDES